MRFRDCGEPGNRLDLRWALVVGEGCHVKFAKLGQGACSLEFRAWIEAAD